MAADIPLAFSFRVAAPPSLAPTRPIDGRLADADGVVPKQAVTFTTASSLVSLQDRLAFFTPAILYLYGGFRDQMLVDFAARHPELEIWYGHTLFDRPLFAGLVDPEGGRSWNHALWCTPAATYRALRPYLASIALSYEPKRWFAETGVQTATIADPLQRVTSVVVDVFGLQATDGLYYLDDSPTPTFRIGPPPAAARVYRDAVLAGENPLLAVELEAMTRRSS